MFDVESIASLPRSAENGGEAGASDDADRGHRKEQTRVRLVIMTWSAMGSKSPINMIYDQSDTS